MTTPARPLRSDAAANRERVLAAASAAVRRDGEKVPMAAIAEAAGVGVGTLYRHYPARSDLLAALERRSYDIVLANARAAAGSRQPPIDALAVFFERTISARDALILPLHGGRVTIDADAVAVRAEISDLLEQVLAAGRADGTVRSDVTAVDLIITGAQLAQPLPHVADWDRLARRQARVFLDGLGAASATRLPGRGPTRMQLETGFGVSS